MKGKLILRAKDKYEPYDCNVFIGNEPFAYELEIFTDLTEPYPKLISTTKDLDASIDTFISINDEPEIIEFYKNCQKNIQNLLQNIEYVEIDYDIKRVIEYIKNNPSLKNKKIVINDYSLFNLETINEIKNNLTDVSNLYFNVEGNYNLIHFQEYNEFILAINNITADVKKYNFSIFETIMYVYDIVRDKVYQEVSPSEDKHLSRNLTSSLTGDKIVCLGYANIFKFILDKLGIDCQVVLLLDKDKNGGHARNEIYIKDSKYNIDGVYYFDPTWDRKKNSNSNSYLASYRYFALTKDEMDKEDANHKYNFYNELLPSYSPDLLDDFNEALNNNNGANMPEDLINTIKHMSMLINNVSLVSKYNFLPKVPDFLKPNFDDIKSKLENLITYFEKPLTADIYIKALYNVRRIEYYKNPNKYPFAFKDFYRILVNSKWQFTHEDIKKLLYTLTTDEKRLIMDLEDLENYFKENDLNKQINYLKLTRTLRNIYEKKINK